MINIDLEKIVTPLMPERTIILDWYDGVVSAFVQFNSIEQWCMINLKAWDLGRKSKVYTLSFLSEQDNCEVLKNS
ncbi:hypothetical protein [Chryseolinea lacunae]|uniref:Uncharacterized protein n=1 Tax=Chryseolinea lacunae TaxID=2801331 RepID=A0ABS1KT20_9BACT|nr:hypothetical protein [Chryseolinea lacunae]MBL0742569.1 hypothetical protein [Chryseolinea lacunae]